MGRGGCAELLVAVDAGSKVCDVPGVTSAFRFWLMVSSTVPREMRRKSVSSVARGLGMSVSLWVRWMI